MASLGMRSGPVLLEPPAPGLWNATPAWLACAPPAGQFAAMVHARTTRATLETCPRVKEISFQHTALKVVEPYLPLPEAVFAHFTS